MEETGNVLNVLRQIHSLDNSEEDICEQEQVSRLNLPLNSTDSMYTSIDYVYTPYPTYITKVAKVQVTIITRFLLLL